LAIILKKDEDADDGYDDEEYDEKRETGAVGWAVYKTYLNAAFGIFGPIVLVFMFVASQGLLLTADYWVSLWATDEEVAVFKYNESCAIAQLKNSTETDCIDGKLVFKDRGVRFTIYASIAGAAFVFSIMRTVIFFGFVLVTTKALHERMFAAIMQTKIRFFDLNPIGRIMNRFSKDVGNLDDVLPLTLFDLCQVKI
jgi:ATP-binding cassette subfamily C (CFTR/MRP) protein 4